MTERSKPYSLEKLDGVIEEMKAYVRAAHGGELPSLVDELIAMRRAEAAKEAAELIPPPEPA